MKAIIFDLDGVLCHTDQLHYKAWKQIADQYGIYFDETINNRLRGVSRMGAARAGSQFRHSGCLQSCTHSPVHG